MRKNQKGKMKNRLLATVLSLAMAVSATPVTLPAALAAAGEYPAAEAVTASAVMTGEAATGKAVAARKIAPYAVSGSAAANTKEPQHLEFKNYTAMLNDENPEIIECKGEVPYVGQTYDFAAVDAEGLAGGTIRYELDADRETAEISESGMLTVKRPGAITVTATLSGNEDYEECEIKYYLKVSGVVSKEGDYIAFKDAEKKFVPGTSDTVSDQKAEKKDNAVTGGVTYSIRAVNGVSIDKDSGKITVTDIDKLAEEVQNGNNEIAVTAEKEATEFYGEDRATYTVTLSFAETPDNPYTLSSADGTNGWYKTKAVVTPADGYEIAQKAGGTFGKATEFSDQGTQIRYVYLRDSKTKAITGRIPVEVKIDSAAPQNLAIEFSELTLVQKLGQNLGFYNPTVTITFTAQDSVSGVDHFTWTYTPENQTPVTGEIAVTTEGEKATAVLTLPADEAEQMRGKISFTAVDRASNEIGKENDYTFVVDTIAPELSVKYQGKAPYEAQENVYDGVHFFNSDVTAEFTITESNFYAEDVVVKVSKDGKAAAEVLPEWDGKKGTVTLSDDGDYVVCVTYTDKAGNAMAEYVSETITVDKTKPAVSVEYVHNEREQKTIFTVTEHNFRKSDIVVTGTVKDINGTDGNITAEQITALLHNAEWTKNGDVYTYEYVPDTDGIYNLKLDYKDPAGWAAESFTAKEFVIDHTAPTEPTVEYITTPWNKFLNAVTFGYYNPSVTVRFTSYDSSSGVGSFTWSYTKERGAGTVNHPDSLADTTIPAVQDGYDKSKFTAEITLTAEEAAQYRGYISVMSTDQYDNESAKKTDDGNIVVVDTIAPALKVEYTAPDRATDDSGFYYNNDVDIKFTVTEANFYEEDIQVTVTKDGKSFDYGKVTWGTRDAKDRTTGTFTIKAPADHTGDGHYVIFVSYTDRSNNTPVTYVSDTHTIDTIKPVIKIEYKNKKAVTTRKDSDGNVRKYFKDTQTAVVTIREHNFKKEDVKFSIRAKDVAGRNKKAGSCYKKSAWTVDSEEDVHTITIRYPGNANYTFDMEYTDMASNPASDYKTDYFTVDKTAPAKLKVDYSESVLDTVLEFVTFGFYNAKMTVTLTAQDAVSGVESFCYSYVNAEGVSSVNAERIKKKINAAQIHYSDHGKMASATFRIPKTALADTEQFNGNVEFLAEDYSDNTAQKHKENKRIVVDNIAPDAQITYNGATNVAGDVSYYNGEIKAVVTVNEANFYAEDVSVMVSKNKGTKTAVTPVWSDAGGDVHVGTFTLTGDGDYRITVHYTDKSSNQMAAYTSKEMTIDTKIEDPTFTINGEAKAGMSGAYKGEAKVGFQFADQNFDAQTVKLTRTRFHEVEDVTDKFIHVSDRAKGGMGSFEIPSKAENDGIYVLHVAMTDRAKHKTESEITFTVNRFGSVYEYSDSLAALIKEGGQYVSSVDHDLVITEYNADRLLEDSVNLLVTKDGENLDVDFASVPEEINSQAGIGESGWYQYAYTIKASNFAEDGVYKISLTSSYAAEDSAKNDSTSVPENSVDTSGNAILDTMTFTVDSAAPEIRNIVNLDQKIADVDQLSGGSLPVRYTIVDVGGLKSVKVMLNDKTIQSVTKEELADDAFQFTGSFEIAEQSGTTAQKVRILATDLAGNVTDTDSEAFLQAHSEDDENSTYIFFDEVTVSRNSFVRWYANKPLFWGSIGGVVVLAAAVSFVAAALRRRKLRKEK